MFFESIFFSQGKTRLLSYHIDRIANAFHSLSKSDLPFPNYFSQLENLLYSLTPPSKDQIYKCRVTYHPQYPHQESISFHPYQAKTINTLQPIIADDIVYNHKYLDRTYIEKLFSQKENADDILIIRRGMVSDTSYCNIVFFDGHSWITPDTPLLKGVMRNYLLNQKIISTASISYGDLQKFKAFKLINAMRDFNTAPITSIEKIQFQHSKL